MLKFVQFACLAFGLSIGSVAAQAVTPSPAMIEQFKKLPRAQQEQLARQYGYDLNQLTGASGKKASAGSGEVEPLTPRHQQQDAEQQRSAVQEPSDDKTLKRFGLNLFNEKISTFAPVDSMPVPDTYVLGVGDSLQVQLYGKQNSQYSLTIDRDGRAMLPDLAPVQLAGLRFANARELIIERVQQAMIGTQAAVSMGELRTINVFIAGEAKNPGMYAVSALSSVTQALFVAGGVSDIGSLREISVKRSGNTVAKFDLYQLLLQGDNSNDVNLQHGDVVFVAPLKAIVEVKGEVLRPALYELASNETVTDLLQMAGGLKADAYAASAVLERINSNKLRDIQTLDLNSAAAKQTKLQNGDVLRLSAVSARVTNQVVLAGAVVRPGAYAWQQNMQLNQLIRSLWADLLPTADLDYAVIVREADQQHAIKVVQLSLADMVQQPIVLQQRDIVLVFHHDNNTYQRHVLNAHIRKQLAPQLSALQLNAALVGDISARAFDKIRLADALGTSDIAARTDLKPADVESLLQAQINLLLNNLFSDNELLALTPHLSRTELLFPVLQRLKQQSSNQQDIAVVSVSGDVKVPGEYPLTENASVSQLLAAAGGATASAYLSRAELSRFINHNNAVNGVQIKHTALDIAAILSGAANDVQLQSRDRLNVFSTPDWSVARKVTLAGEVRFPGQYSMQKGETLADVIQRAGGFTDNAFIKGAVFTRKQIQQIEQEQQKRLLEQLKADIATRSLSAQITTTAPAEAMAMITELEKQQPVGRLVIDAEQILAGNPEYNLTLEDGDRLVVPRTSRTVSIIGEVQLAGTHRHDASLDVEHYLRLAGGLRKRADEDRIYVIRADGSVLVPTLKWYAVSDRRLQPGDTIVVPLDTDYKDSLSLWAQVTQIFYQTAVAIAALNSF